VAVRKLHRTVGMSWVTARAFAMPALGLGTYRLRGEACTRVVEMALQLGYRHLDTARAYDNEGAIGRAIRAAGVPRRDLFLTTKIPPDGLRRNELRRALADSLGALGTDYVDLVLIHWLNAAVPLEETLEALLAVLAHGRTRAIGLSNFTPSLVEAACRSVPIACHQIEYHPFLAQDEHLALAERHDFVVTAYAPLARGRVATDAALRAIAREYDRPPTQVALRWLLQQRRVAAIPKASSREHLESNLAALGFELDPHAMRRISSCARGERVVDPDYAPEWGT
jgi:2,5-diketo-D-gluconate reductase B